MFLSIPKNQKTQTLQMDSICSASSGMGLSLSGNCIECGIEDVWDVIHCDEAYNGPGGTFWWYSAATFHGPSPAGVPSLIWHVFIELGSALHEQ